VQVTFDRADDHGADRLDTFADQQRTQQVGACLHGAGGDQDIGYIDLIGLELDTDDLHAGQESLIEDLLCGIASIDGFLDHCLNVLGFAFLQRF